MRQPDKNDDHEIRAMLANAEMDMRAEGALDVPGVLGDGRGRPRARPVKGGPDVSQELPSYLRIRSVEAARELKSGEEDDDPIHLHVYLDTYVPHPPSAQFTCSEGATWSQVVLFLLLCGLAAGVWMSVFGVR